MGTKSNRSIYVDSVGGECLDLAIELKSSSLPFRRPRLRPVAAVGNRVKQPQLRESIRHQVGQATKARCSSCSDGTGQLRRFHGVTIHRMLGEFKNK